MEDIKLGIGTRLYFLTLLYHILVFTVAFVFYSLYALITNLNASSNPPLTQKSRRRRRHCAPRTRTVRLPTWASVPKS